MSLITLTQKQADLSFDILELMESYFGEDEDIHMNIPVLELLLESFKSTVEVSQCKQ